MNHTIDTLYPPKSVNGKRIATDTFFTAQADCSFQGILDRTIRFVEDFQLLDGENWARFVSQFKIHSDVVDRGWRGEYWGKMMRGAAFTYAYTRNPALYQAMKATVEDMLTAQDGLGRISSYDQANEFNGWDLWCRKYVLLGMQFFYEVCEDEALKARMLQSMCRQADYLMEKLGPQEQGKLPITLASQTWRGLNSSSILEPIVRLYDLTEAQKYLDFAAYIVGEGGTSICNIFEIAYEDKTDPYQYPVMKAYEMMSCFEGLLEYYRATGMEKYRETVIRFAKRVMHSDITIIGSAGCTHELFDHSAARQTDTAYQGIMQETCVTVTWMKLCWQLLSLTGDAAFADHFERALYNAYLGAVNTERNVDADLIGRTFPGVQAVALPFDSYSNLLPNTRGRGIGGLKLMPDQHYYGCCACIGAAGTGLIAKTAVMLTREGVAVNLYIPGQVTCQTPGGRRVTLGTQTRYPVDGAVTLTLDLAESEEFEIRLRIPDWSAYASLAVNGVPQVIEKGYTPLRRVWKKGDTIALALDFRTKVIPAPRNPRDLLMRYNGRADLSTPRVVEETPDAKDHIALQRGPLVLACDARLGRDVDEPVAVAFSREGIVEAVAEQTAPFDCQLVMRVPQVNGEAFLAVDYASAGKTWREDSRFGCWLPTKPETK